MHASVPSRPQDFRFGSYVLDVASGELRKDGAKIRIEGQPLQVLAILLERPGELITREEVQQRLWPEETFVDFERGINTAVTRLRQALHDSAENPRFIETLPRRGYRFIYPLNGPASAVLVVADHPRNRWFYLSGLALAAVALFFGANYGALRRKPQALFHSVVVLPFQNLTGDAALEHVADGVTDTLTTELAQFKAIRVISATSAMHYKRHPKPLREIVSDLGVDAVIEGSVTRSSTQGWVVNVQLVEGSTDRHLWAKRYEQLLDDIPVMQGRLARDVVSELRVNLSPQEQERLARRRSAHPEAYAAYIKGRQLWWKRITEEGHWKSIAYYREAIEKDPAFAEAYAAMARSYTFLWQLDPTPDTLLKVNAATQKALELDPELGEAHSVLGWIRRHSNDPVGAESEYRKAVELSPSDALSRMFYAAFLNEIQRHEEALAEIRVAERLDPLSEFISANVVQRLALLGRYSEAEQQARRAIELDPDFWLTYQFLGGARREAGRIDDAILAWEKALSLPGAYEHWPLSDLVEAYVAARRPQDARRALERLQRLSKSRWIEPVRMALANAAVGDKQEALRWLHHGMTTGRPGGPRYWKALTPYLGNDPEFMKLRQQWQSGRQAGKQA